MVDAQTKIPPPFNHLLGLTRDVREKGREREAPTGYHAPGLNLRANSKVSALFLEAADPPPNSTY